MDNDSHGSHHRQSSQTFWRKNVQAVPGRPSLKQDLRQKRLNNQNSLGTGASFKDFQESIDDAWDTGDDEFCTVSDVRISKKVSQSAALNVIKNHKSSDSSQLNDHHSLLKTATSNHHHSNYNRQPSKSDFHLGSKELSDGESKIDRFQLLLNSPLLNLEELRQLSWSGVPSKLRSVTWKLLSEYLPANFERRQHVLERKRLDYWNLVKQYYDTEREEGFQDTYRQIHIDIPRMSPLISLFQQSTVQLIFERILYIWAIRHPASGYVQGMNDLVTPFFLVFLQEKVPSSLFQDIENFDVASLPKEQRDVIEADTFWCLSKFLDGIQDNYIFAQLGIQTKVNQLKDLIQRVDGPLHQHLQQRGIDYLQFSFRWLNNLLTRELPLHCTIRLWDTYLAESDSAASFQLYVCAAFLLRWRRNLLLQPDFQSLMLMLQNLPTQNWTDSDICVLVAEAYKLKFTFADAPNHLQPCGAT